MRTEWDPRKAVRNLRKHRVRFADGVDALEDPNGVTLKGDHPLEERFVTLGLDGKGRLPVVVHLQRGDSIRVISVRKATRRERTVYERKP